MSKASKKPIIALGGINLSKYQKIKYDSCFWIFRYKSYKKNYKIILMNSDINKEIEIVINRFKSGDYKFTINKTTILLKKFPYNDMLWNIKGLSLQTIGNIKKVNSMFFNIYKYKFS